MTRFFDPLCHSSAAAVASSRPKHPPRRPSLLVLDEFTIVVQWCQRSRLSQLVGRSRRPREDRTTDQQDAGAIGRWLTERDKRVFLKWYFDPPLTDEGRRVADLEKWILGIAQSISSSTHWLLAGWNVIRMPGGRHRGPLPPADDELIQLAAELCRYVTHLAEEIGERNVLNRPRELAQSADYIETEFAGAGYEVERQEYEVSGTTCCNLEVEIPGATAPDEIVVIGAHYDSVEGSPAANDNASGVAAILSLARRFARIPGDRTLRLAAFVNEEKPFAHTEQMGSWVYARRCRERGENVTAMMSLETIGCYSDEPGSQKYPPPVGLLYPSTGNFVAFVGNTRYGWLVRQVTAAFRRSEPFPSEGGALPEAIPNIGFSDHWSFWQEGYPALMVTDTAPFRYPYYHTPEDTVDKIDFEKTARVVRGLGSVVSGLVRVDQAAGTARKSTS